MSKMKTYLAAVAAFLGFGSVAFATPVTVAIPAEIDPGQIINDSLTLIASYLPAILGGLIVFSLCVALIKFFIRAPRRVVK